jgi:ubiquinone/menaquinone biosynthesis C-methylase UbiE
MNDDVTRPVRDSYNRIADEYARRIADELRHKPLDRELLDRFANERRGQGEVCDMGCGPGHVARYLKDKGLDVFGLDLSPAMLIEARQLNPDIRFIAGNVMKLELPAQSLGGITAFYAIVNIPEESLPAVFGQMQRVLKPGGVLLLAFHTGDEALHEEEIWGRSISMDLFLFPPARIQRCLEQAGFAVDEVVERGPYAPDVEYQSHRAYIFARKPAR